MKRRVAGYLRVFENEDENVDYHRRIKIGTLSMYVAVCAIDGASTTWFIHSSDDINVGLASLCFGRVVVALLVLGLHLAKVQCFDTSTKWLFFGDAYLHMCAVWFAVQTARASQELNVMVVIGSVGIMAMHMEILVMNSLVTPPVTEKPAQGTSINQTDKGPQDIPKMTALGFILGMIKEMRKSWFAVSVLLVVLQQGIAAWIPKVQTDILDHIVNASKNEFKQDLALYAVILFIQPLVGYVGSQCVVQLQAYLNRDMAVKLFTTFMKQDIAFYDAVPTGQMVNRLSVDLPQATAPVSVGMNTILGDVVLLVTSLSVCWRANWRLTLVAYTTLIPVAQVILASSSWISGVCADALKAGAEAVVVVMEALNNIRTTRTLGLIALDRSREKYEIRQDTIKEATVKAQKAILLIGLFGTGIDNVATIILYACGGYFLLGGGEDVGVQDIAPFMLLWRQMSAAFQGIFHTMGAPLKAMGAAERVFGILSVQPSIQERAGFEIPEGQIMIKFEAVRFAYLIKNSPKGQRAAETLRGFSLTIPSGANHALVGDTSAGKSTVFKLLLRYYDPTSGSITVNEKELKDVNLESFRRRIGVIPQTTQLFRMTMAENISYGLESCSPDAIREAAELAQLMGSISKLPGGLNHECDDKTLCGGELQRISFARAILRRPTLMLLDEHTASLPLHVEQQLAQTMQAIRNDLDPTIITIAHKPSVFQSAEKIWVLQDGQVVQQGTHAELVKQGGEYARLLSASQAHEPAQESGESMTSSSPPLAGKSMTSGSTPLPTKTWGGQIPPPPPASTTWSRVSPSPPPPCNTWPMKIRPDSASSLDNVQDDEETQNIVQKNASENFVKANGWLTRALTREQLEQLREQLPGGEPLVGGKQVKIQRGWSIS